MHIKLLSIVIGISGALLASSDSQTTQVPGFEEVGDGTLVSTQNLYESSREGENPETSTGSPLRRTERIPPQTYSLFDWARDLNRHK